ncbi:hypothetical protein, partial [Longimicrobium sp.]|uniref:hypothetical protein n=1 Tax=Longimicrobium sp. TaxID=2029185 RepID=UPI002F91E705
MLSPRQQATLVALCRRMVPLPEEPDPSAARLARAVEVRIGTLHAERARGVGFVLNLLDSRLAGLAAAARPSGFSALHGPRQDAWLRRWEVSPAPALRSA